MRETNLGGVERKLLGALLILSDKHNVVETSIKNIATTMGYKATGGAITFAFKSLEMNNYITVIGNGKIKVLV